MFRSASPIISTTTTASGSAVCCSSSALTKAREPRIHSHAGCPARCAIVGSRHRLAALRRVGVAVSQQARVVMRADDDPAAAAASPFGDQVTDRLVQLPAFLDFRLPAGLY